LLFTYHLGKVILMKRWFQALSNTPDKRRNCGCGKFMRLSFEDSGRRWFHQEWVCKCGKVDWVEYEPPAPPEPDPDLAWDMRHDR
jgi:hypothetical protein